MMPIRPLHPLGNGNTLGFFFHFFVQTTKRSNKSVVYGAPSNLSPFVPALHRLKRTPSSRKKRRLLFGGETFYSVDDGADGQLCATESTFSEDAEAFESDVPSFSSQRCTKGRFSFFESFTQDVQLTSVLQETKNVCSKKCENTQAEHRSVTSVRASGGSFTTPDGSWNHTPGAHHYLLSETLTASPALLPTSGRWSQPLCSAGIVSRRHEDGLVFLPHRSLSVSAPLDKRAALKPFLRAPASLQPPVTVARPPRSPLALGRSTHFSSLRSINTAETATLQARLGYLEKD